MRMRSTSMALTLVLSSAALTGCASWERKSQQVPAGVVQLAELKRNEYRVGERVSGKASVRVERNMLNKLLPALFGDGTISGDQSYSSALGMANEVTITGTRGSAGGFVGFSNSSGQLSDILNSIFSNDSNAIGDSTAVSHATAAAYFRALEAAPGADFLLQPRVEIVTRGSSSKAFFVPDDETAEVIVSGKPVTVFSDGSHGAPAPAPAAVTP